MTEAEIIDKIRDLFDELCRLNEGKKKYTTCYNQMHFEVMQVMDKWRLKTHRDNGYEATL